MDSQAASQLARDLFETAQRMRLGLQTGSTFQIVVRDVRDLLGQLVPDGEARVMQGDDRPHVLILAGESLFVLSVSINDGQHELRLASAPVDPAALALHVEEWYGENRRGVSVRHRRWTLAGGSLQGVSVRTEDFVGETEASDDERFVRQVAAAVGWQAPPQPAVRDDA